MRLLRRLFSCSVRFILFRVSYLDSCTKILYSDAKKIERAIGEPYSDRSTLPSAVVRVKNDMFGGLFSFTVPNLLLFGCSAIG